MRVGAEKRHAEIFAHSLNNHLILRRAMWHALWGWVDIFLLAMHSNFNDVCDTILFTIKSYGRT